MRTLTFIALALCATCGAQANDKSTTTRALSRLVIPNEQQATAAVVEMASLGEIKAQVKATLGTCIPAVDAKHVGQVACTVAVSIGAGTTETQADFYRNGPTWVAQPSTSQDKLPFPDPAL